MIVLDDAALRRALPLPAAIDALEAAFRAGGGEAPVRQHLATPHGDLLVMPAWDGAAAGCKIMGFGRDSAARGLPALAGAYLLLEGGTLVPRALVDGAALTALRTGAVSALATRMLAREDARRLVVFGAGVQARAHLEAMAAVRPVEEVTVVARNAAAGAALVARARELGLRARAGAADAVRSADLVCTCTPSPAPLFAGGDLAAGAHVNAVGSYRPDLREVDAALVRRARVVVERRDAALAEAGDLLQLGERAAAEAIAADLTELVRGARVREAGAAVTLFESVGLATEDLAVARAAVDAAA